MKKYLSKFLAVVLCVSVILCTLPLTAFAAENPEEENKIISEAVDETEATIVTEVVDERTADKKVFLLSDGSYLAAFYPHHVHFEENGVWQDIDNTLVSGLSDEDVVENKNNSFKIKFSNKAKDKKLVSIKKENYKIDWALDGSKKVRVETISSDSQSNSPTTLKNLYGTAIYKDILSDTDLKYTVTPLKIKEDIIIKSANAPESFTFNYEFKNLSHRITQENTVELYDENSGETVFSLDAPFMYDAAGVYSGDIELKISETDKGIELVLIPDNEWISDKERVFPVVIDPTMPLDYDYQNTKDATVSFATRANTVGASSLLDENEITGEKAYLKVGKRYTDELGVAIYHDVHNHLPKGVNIVNAQLSFCAYRESLSTCSSNLQINAYEIETNWDQNTIIKNEVLFLGENPGTPNHSTTVLDYIIYNDASSSTQGKRYTFDITKAVQKWHSGQMVNRGIMLRATGLGSSEQYARFYDSDFGQNYEDPNGNKIETDPQIVVTYRDAVGLENYWSYISHSIGENDAGHVNLYNGNLVYVHNIAAFNSEINGFTLSLICNSLESGSNWAHCGNGWKLNLIQTFKAVTIKDNSYVKYVYTDADGTKHYFVQNSDGSIVDEDGLGLTYSNNSGVDSTLPHKITDKDKNAYYFNSKGYLRKIADSNNNYISLTYTDISSTDAKLTSVTTSSGGLITLQYNSDNLLYRITDNAQRITEFDYNNTNLASIKYPDERTTAFGYDNNTFSVTSSDNSKIKYNYDSDNGRVERVENIGKNETTGNVLTFEYDYNQTKVTDSNDKKITYQFDTFGRPVCVYDNNQNIYSQTYTQSVQTGSGIFANNKLATSSNGAVYVNNLIIDPTFSKGMSHWSHYSNSSLSTCSIVTTNSLLSSNSMLLTTGENKHSCVVQSVSTGAGKTYTLSAYMKLVNVSSNGYGAGLEVRTSNNRFFHTLKTGTTDTTIDNGFEKVTLTVTLQEGETISIIGAGLFYSLGSVYVDSVQLEEGDTANTINLLSNSSFEKNGGNGTLPNYYVSDRGLSVGGCRNTVQLAGGLDYTMRIIGYYNLNAALYQTVNVSGKVGDVYSFGGWAKADSIPKHTEAGYTSCFEMSIKVVYTDGTVEWFASPFNVHVNDWQFSQRAFCVKKDYNRIDLYFGYNHNCNTAYFDNLFLYRDTMQSYIYDSNGNVVSTADYASQNSNYNFTNNNLSKMITPMGSGYEYFYDSKGNLVSSRSSEGLINRIMYDSQGNPVSTYSYSDDSSASLQSGKTYYIQQKTTGEYLTVQNGSTTELTKVVEAAFNGGEEQKWKVVQSPKGGFYLFPQNAPGMALDVYQPNVSNEYSMIIYYQNGSDAQIFNFNPQRNYTYQIEHASSQDEKVLSVNRNITNDYVSALAPYGEMNSDQCWYFKEVIEGTPRSITDGIYQIRIRHSGKYLDAYTVTEGSNVIQWEYNLSSAVQRFNVRRYNNTEYYTFSPVDNSNLYVTVSSDLNADSHPYVRLGDSQITDNKLFKLQYSQTLQAWQIICKVDESKCVSVERSSLVDLAKTVVKGNSVSLEQGFFFEKLSDKITSSATYQDNGNYIHTVTDSRGNTTTYNYDTQRGTLLGVQDAMGNTVSYSYNQLNDRLNSVTSGQSTVSYEYETNGGIKKITSPSGTEYNFTYDEFGRNVGISVGSENLSTTTYENEHSSLVKEFEYGNGVKKEYTYDNQDRLVSEKIGGIEKVRYIYNKLGNVAQINDYSVNVTTKFSYDLIGRITGITSSDGQKLRYNYDTFNRLKMSKWSLNNISLTSEYIYGDTAVSGQKANIIYGVKTNGIEDLKYTYDGLCRLKTKTLATHVPYTINYGYREGAESGSTTNLIGSIDNGGRVLDYYYDANGNISAVTENGGLLGYYTYDSKNQLISAEDYSNTYNYTYDNNGNILSVTKNGETIKTYTYGNANWKDLLTQYNGQTITYDTIGNPLQYRDGMNFTWSNGRQLSSVTNGANSYSYTYNADSLRTSKTVNGVTTNYYWSNGILQAQKTGDEYLIFLYDENGSAYGFLVKNGTTQQKYYYLFNAQGDVIGIIDSNGTQVVNYTYGAWGDILSVTGTLASTVGQLNPIRYRGYYYDSETGFYYLQTRYYDPEICRFINADGVISGTGESVKGYNLFVYCFNNPVNMSDTTGSWPQWIENIITKIKNLFNPPQTVKYKVPLYKQGDTNLCWAYSQTMIESYNNNTKLKKKEAEARAKEIAVSVHGEENWDQGGWPTGVNPTNGIKIDNITSLYDLVVENGPVYAYYANSDNAHLVVVTGVSVYRNTVYTNNPWGTKGSQSFNSFKNGVAKKWYEDGQDLKFMFIYLME